MAVKFVIKKFYINGNSAYYHGESEFGHMFDGGIYDSFMFDTYGEAEIKLSHIGEDVIKSIFQIEKIFLN